MEGGPRNKVPLHSRPRRGAPGGHGGSRRPWGARGAKGRRPLGGSGSAARRRSYSHFVGQPWVGRQRDLEGHLRPAGESGERQAGRCGRSGPRGAAADTYMVQPVQTRRLPRRRFRREPGRPAHVGRRGTCGGLSGALPDEPASDAGRGGDSGSQVPLIERLCPERTVRTVWN